MIIQQQMSTEMVDEKEVQKPTDRFDVFTELEKETTEGEKVIIKELTGSYTLEEAQNQVDACTISVQQAQAELVKAQSILDEINKQKNVNK